MWFRNDLRLHDNPALLSAAGDGGPVLAVYIWNPSDEADHGGASRENLGRSLQALADEMDGRLLLCVGEPTVELARAAGSVGATEVHVTADLTPEGGRRDAEVERRLRTVGIELCRTGSRYAVTPGRIRKNDGTPYRVFTPFYRAWRENGWRAPAGDARSVTFLPVAECQPPPWEVGPELRPATAGETAAGRGLGDFLTRAVGSYHRDRERPDLPGTSQLSAALKFGELHPRSVLAALAHVPGEGA